MSYDLGFSEPLDWDEEDEEYLEATKQVYRIFKRIVQGGNSLDCVDE